MSFDDFHTFVAENAPNIAQVVILQHGEAAYRDCWHGYTPMDTVHTMSVTKSVVSLLVGIALDQGLISSIDDPVLDYFPDYKIKRGEKTIQQVTLRHLLTMTAPYKYRSEPWSKICVQDDWSVAALDFLGGRRGLTGEFRYSTLGIHILTGIIAARSGLSTTDFANRTLFAPLGIASREIYVAPDAAAHKAFTISKTPKGPIWFSDPMGVGAAGYGLCLSATEMAKLGQLCLRGGTYDGARIVSAAWIEESTCAHSTGLAQFQDMRYGYLWWIIDEAQGSYAAIGNSGNVIYVNPQKDLVVAIAATFRPSVLDRIPFIVNHIEPRLD